VIDVGAKKNEVVATEATAELGTATTRLDETEFGTLTHETIANDGDEAITITWVAGNEETALAGTITGVNQVSGTVTEPETETEIKAVLGTD
jgi:hypothetical protein